MILLYFVTIFHFIEFCIDGSVILAMYTMLLLVDFIFFDKHRNVVAYLFSFLIIFTMYNMSIYLQLSYLWCMFVALIMFIMPMVWNKLNHFLKMAFMNVGNISIIISTIMLMVQDNCNRYLLFVLYLVSFAIYLLYGLYKDIKSYKIISYLFLNIMLFTFVGMIGISEISDIYRYIVPITTVMIIVLEYFVPKFRDKYNYYFVILQVIVSFIILNSNINIWSFGFIILLNFIFIWFKLQRKSNDNIYYISAISLVPSIYYSDLLIVGNINLMYFISIILIGLIMYFSYSKKHINVYTIIVYGYVLLHIMMLDINKYVSVFIFMAVSFIHYLSNNNGWKDLFRFLVYCSDFILYLFIVNDIGIGDYTLFNVGGYLIFLIATTRTILNKYVSDYKILEYIFSIIINFVAIVSYYSEYDGMLFIALLVTLTIISYLYKVGPIFIVSISFILINVLLLTRNFWLSIPWWLYILFIGSVLIVFAVKNELNDKRNKKIKSKFNDLKKNLDL